ncbi:hypothetical protein [Streptomyces sp. NPDC051567]|uniref:hypothetical protein n=1 Tax=Streptomyces sp. NPDC051567 TaxID=3365660 RepID=UPI003792DCA3
MPTDRDDRAPLTDRATPLTDRATPMADRVPLTDRDERALVAAAENRIGVPLRIGAAPAAVRRLLARLARPAGERRESVPCRTTPKPTPKAKPKPTTQAQAPAPAPVPR